MQEQLERTRRSSRQFQRSYQACRACRNRKVKCDISIDGPPCHRCRRQRKDCLFDSERTAHRSQPQKGSSIEVHALANEPQVRHHLNHIIAEEQSLLSHQFDEHVSPAADTPRIQMNQSCGRRPDPVISTPTNCLDAPPATSSQNGAFQTQTPNSDLEQQSHWPPTTGLATSVMRTLVTSGNDALNMLFEAASHDGNSLENAGDEYLRHQNAGAQGTSSHSISNHAHTNPVYPNPSLDVIKIWEACRFVTMGWVTATDAIVYVDMFFKTMSDLSPVLTSYFASHDHHHELLAQEPMLCCTILTISTRYHVLPGLAGMSKSYFLHNRLWKYWQDLVSRVMFGQSKGLERSLRSLGTIESLLIMTDWHPRSLNFPPEPYGWNIDLVPTSLDAVSAVDEQHKPVNQWLEDVIEPTRRSDRMSWMLLGAAFTLAHELGIFDIHTRRSEAVRRCGSAEQSSHRHQQVVRAQKLLYIYGHQLASRIGCAPMVSQYLNLIVSGEISRESLSANPEGMWDFFMGAWIALTKLVKAISDIFFPSAASTREQLRSGRYIGLLDHFRPLLSHWREKYLDVFTVDTAEQYYNILFIEHQYIETLLNSFGIQAIVERNLADKQAEPAFEDDRIIILEDMDLEYIQSVITGSCRILEMVPELARSGRLRFMPVRFYLRVTSVSVLLLKALCLGVRRSQLKSSLDVIDRSNQALKSCTLDDMHLAPQYATLLDMHIIKLRRRFVLSAKNGGEPISLSLDWNSIQPRDALNPLDSDTEGPDEMSADPGSLYQDLAPDDWLSLPFDPSMAPFELNGDQMIPGFDEGTLNFAWSLPCL